MTLVKVSFAAALAFLSLAGCGGSSPTAPAPPPSVATPGGLVVDQTSLVLTRYASRALHAGFNMPGGVQLDVTSVASWSSSNAAVTVDAGRVTAAGLGTATVTVQYEGHRESVAVTARRPTAITGAILVRDANGRATIRFAEILDGSRTIGSHVNPFVSPHSSDSVGVNEGSSWGFQVIDPGTHQLALRVSGQVAPPNAYAADAASHVNIVDRDTLDTLEVIPLAVRHAMLSERDEMRWTVEVPTFTK